MAIQIDIRAQTPLAKIFLIPVVCGTAAFTNSRVEEFRAGGLRPLDEGDRLFIPPTDTAELAQGASLSLFGRISGRTLHLLTQISVGRFFGPEAYGLFAIGLTIFRISGLISVLGMDTSVLRFGVRHKADSRGRLSWVLLVGIGAPLLIGTTVGIAIFLAAPWLASVVFDKPSLEQVIRLFALGIGPLAGLQVAAAATRISKRMQFWVLSEELTQPALALLLTLVAALLGLGILGAVAAIVISVGVALIVALYYVRKLFPGVLARSASLRGPWREFLTYSITVSGSRISIALMYWMDRLVLGSFWPAEVVGVYQAAAQSAILFAIILTSFNRIFTPLVADLWHRGELIRLEAVYRISTKWGLYMSLPLFVVVWSAPGLVLSAVFGPEYALGALSLRILALGQLINVGTGGVGLMLAITGHQRRWVLTAIAAFAADVVLLLILIPRYGMLGAAIATSATLSGMYVVGLIQVRHTLALWPYDRRYLKGLIAGLASLAALNWMIQLQFGHPLLALVALTTVSIVIFGVVLLALGLDAEDREFIVLIRSRLSQVWRDSDE